ncbi:probable ATP-dependent RNA helicase DDX4 [Daphnia carinata]|uniref:probable ATP-dependent RNA helicase DDX4 n=1 Tax=Daphnia carinata TaxID=120202 RepID=UPI0028684EBE|nr:probable ATP-dependent RNA helicase DDX4 [Daphnia carinata]
MLDMGFGPNVEKIINYPTMHPKGIRRVCMFSDAFPDEVQELAATYMEDYIFVTTGIVDGTNPGVEQLFFQCSKRDKRAKLIEVLQDLGCAKTILFVNSKKTADFVAAFSYNNNLQSTSIHGECKRKS